MTKDQAVEALADLKAKLLRLESSFAADVTADRRQDFHHEIRNIETMIVLLEHGSASIAEIELKIEELQRCLLTQMTSPLSSKGD
jgi:hypothetical protein